jgi:hypothetical protein
MIVLDSVGQCLDDQHPCPECGKPTDNEDDQARAKRYCSRACVRAVGTRTTSRMYAARRGSLVACTVCGELYLPPSVCDPCCSLRCVHAKKRRAA